MYPYIQRQYVLLAGVPQALTEYRYETAAATVRTVIHTAKEAEQQVRLATQWSVSIRPERLGSQMRRKD